MIYRYLLILFIIPIFSSCFPGVKFDYYEPRADEGILKKTICNGAYGPPGIIEFSQGSVTISVQSDETENGLLIAMVLKVPKNNEVKLSHRDVLISTEQNSNAFKGKLNPIIFEGMPEWDIDATIIGETVEHDTIWGTNYYGKHFYLNAIVNMPKFKTVIVQLPTLSINNKKVTVPNILFTKKKYTESFLPLNGC